MSRITVGDRVARVAHGSAEVLVGGHETALQVKAGERGTVVPASDHRPDGLVEVEWDNPKHGTMLIWVGNLRRLSLLELIAEAAK